MMSPRGGGVNYRGLVVLCLVVVCGLATVVCLRTRLCVVVVLVLDETREECFARWRTVLRGAASTDEASANEATSATSSAFHEIRFIRSPSSRQR
jgi:hypothetical protein